MSIDFRAQIHNNFHQKETEELVQIWQSNNHAEYTDQDFDIIREILQARHEPLPPLSAPVAQKIIAPVQSSVEPADIVQVLFSFKGRIDLQTFWLLGVLPLVGWSILFGILEGATPEYGPYSGLPTLAGRLLIIWPALAVTIKRLHDRDMSGWWLFFGLIPIIGQAWILVNACLIPGNKKPNKFGIKSL